MSLIKVEGKTFNSSFLSISLNWPWTRFQVLLYLVNWAVYLFSVLLSLVPGDQLIGGQVQVSATGYFCSAFYFASVVTDKKCFLHGTSVVETIKVPFSLISNDVVYMSCRNSRMWYPVLQLTSIMAITLGKPRSRVFRTLPPNSVAM